MNAEPQPEGETGGGKKPSARGHLAASGAGHLDRVDDQRATPTAHGRIHFAFPRLAHV